MTEWQPIATAPKDSTRFQGSDKTGEQAVCFYKLINGKYYLDVTGYNGYDAECDFEPSHWMPLPNKPNPNPQE